MFHDLRITSPGLVESPWQTTLQYNPLMPLIRQLMSASDQASRLECEKAIQRRLNEKVSCSQEELDLLQQQGYSITQNPETIERFRAFSMPNEPELSQLIQMSTSEGGLLVDRFKMYRPGPASAKALNGAAKGYDEIFALFEEQTSEKTDIAESIANSIHCFYNKLPERHRWKSTSTILDMGCGNGVQSLEFLKSLQERFPHHPWKLVGIDNQIGSIEKCETLFQELEHPFSGTFKTHDLFAQPWPSVQGQADIILISHVYFSKERIPEFLERIREYRAKNCLLVFVHGTKGADGDNLANSHDFMRGKPSSTMSEDFQECLEENGFKCETFIEESVLSFPPLTPPIREAILSLKRGDYENPYPGIDKDFKTIKGLMEFYASFPLESMSVEERALYLGSLEKKFTANQGSFLKICDRIMLACPLDCETDFVYSFNELCRSKPAFNDSYMKAKKALESGHAIKAIDVLTSAIQIVNDEMNVIHFEKKEWSPSHVNDIIRGCQLLSDAHIKVSLYPKAAGLLWYAKYLEKERGLRRVEITQELEDQIEQIERRLLTGDINAKIPHGGMAQAKKDRQKLQDLREEIKAELFALKDKTLPSPEKADELRVLYKEMTRKLKGFISELVNDSVALLAEFGQHPPCEYALIGLGSLAREEMTPFSDFEFAILIDGDDDTKEYFRNLTILLHLKIINLGETILPCLSIDGLDIYDEITPRGIAFDGSVPTACKTPLGKQLGSESDYELISSPRSMSKYQHSKKPDEEFLWLLKRYHLPTILSNTTFITGSPKGEQLFQNYETAVSEELQGSERQKRALYLLPDDLRKFTPDLENEISGKIHSVKKDLYRLVNTMFDGLADYCNLKAKSTWDRIEELEKWGIVTQGGAQDLKELTMLSQELRLTTYFHHKSQKEELQESDNEIVYELYYRALPFTEAMQKFCDALQKQSRDPLEALKTPRFYSPSPYHKGLVDQRLMKYLKAEKSLQEETEKTAEYCELFGDVKQTLGQYAQAEALYREALEMPSVVEDPKWRAHLYKKIGDVRKQMARIKEDETGAQFAYHQAAEILGSIPKPKEKDERDRIQKALEGLDRAQAELKIYQARYPEAEKFLELAKKRAAERTKSMEKDAKYGVIPDVSLAANLELEAKIARDFHSRFKEAEGLLESARKTYKSYYKRSDHPKVMACKRISGSCLDVRDLQLKRLDRYLKIFGDQHPQTAISYNDLGETLGQLGYYQEALKNQKKALAINQQIFGDQHSTVAESYNNVGGILGKLGDYQKALKKIEHALKIDQQIFGDQHPNTAASYNNVGKAQAELGDYDKAFENEKKALAINQQVFGDHHRSTAASCDNVGKVLERLGRRQESLEMVQKALRIYQELFGDRHPDTATSFNNVGNVFRELGCYQDGLKMVQKALNIRQSIFGDQDSYTAVSYNDLGYIFGELDRHPEALEMQQKALAIWQQVFGDQHPHTATSYNNVGRTLGALGRHQEALEMQQKALVIYKQFFGDQHPHTAACIENMGRTLGALGCHQEALEMHQKAWAIHQQIFGDQHPNTLLSSDFVRLEKLNIEINKLLHTRKFKKAYAKCKQEKTYAHAINRLQIAILLKENKKIKSELEQLQTLLNDPKIPLLAKARGMLTLADYFLKQGEFEKAVRFGNLAAKVDSAYLFNYSSLDIQAMNEELSMKGKRLPVSVVGVYYALRGYKAQSEQEGLPNGLIVPFAKKLLKLVESEGLVGDKIDQIKSFAKSCLV